MLDYKNLYKGTVRGVSKGNVVELRLSEESSFNLFPECFKQIWETEEKVDLFLKEMKRVYGEIPQLDVSLNQFLKKLDKSKIPYKKSNLKKKNSSMKTKQKTNSVTFSDQLETRKIEKEQTLITKGEVSLNDTKKKEGKKSTGSKGSVKKTQG